MRCSKALKYFHQCIRRKVNLQDMNKSRKLKLLECQCLSLMRGALGDFLQLLGEYYLHKEWKGSRLHLQATGKCYLHKEWKGLYLLLQQNRNMLGSTTRTKVKPKKKCKRRNLAMRTRGTLT